MDKQMLLKKLKARGYSESVIEAFAKVQRERFVPPRYRDDAHEDTALPIGFAQTISQPSTIAFMLEKLDARPKQRILEVGSGSGYVLALLAEIAPGAEIYGTERIAELAEHSREALVNYDYVRVEYTPDRLGLPEKAPFSRILVSAAAATELPPELIAQLSDKGVMVCPVGNSIIKAVNSSAGIKTEEYPGFAFVELYQNGPNP